MLQGAMFCVLSRQLHDGTIKIMDSLKLDSPKTKDLSRELSLFLKGGSSTLVIPAIAEKNIYKAGANRPKFKSLNPNSLNIFDLLRFKQILIDKDAVGFMDGHYKMIGVKPSANK